MQQGRQRLGEGTTLAPGWGPRPSDLGVYQANNLLMNQISKFCKQSTSQAKHQRIKDSINQSTKQPSHPPRNQRIKSDQATILGNPLIWGVLCPDRSSGLLCFTFAADPGVGFARPSTMLPLVTVVTSKCSSHCLPSTRFIQVEWLIIVNLPMT